MIKRLFASALLALGLFVGQAYADHNPGGILPLTPNTPAQQFMIRNGYITWCADPRAQAYPHFIEDVQATNDYASYVTTIGNVYVPWGSSNCYVQHTMPDQSFCDGCAGQILYANWPVIIKYKWQLGYFEWKTTAGHEGTVCGHDAGEHEGYDDRNFVSHYLEYGTWASPWNGPTVMDFGTGVWQCTSNDVRLIFSWLLPNAPTGGSLVGNTIWYGGSDLSVTTRVAVYYRTYTGYTFWTGQWLDPKSCNGLVCGGANLTLPIGPCTEVLIDAQNAIPASWGRQLTSIGGTSCFAS